MDRRDFLLTSLGTAVACTALAAADAEECGEFGDAPNEYAITVSTEAWISRELWPGGPMTVVPDRWTLRIEGREVAWDEAERAWYFIAE